MKTPEPLSTNPQCGSALAGAPWLDAIDRESHILAQSENITVNELAFFYVEIAGLQRRTIEAFCEEVNRRAELNMLKTHKLEGSHYAAMKQIRAELASNGPDRGRRASDSKTI